MDELGEIPQKERTVVSPELAERMGDATAAIEGELQKPEVQVAKGTEQMSMFAEFGKLAKDSTMRRLGVMFKDAKAGLGILPFINKVSEVIAPAGKMVTTVSAVEGAVAAENTLLKAGQSEEKAKNAYGKSIEKNKKAIAKGRGVDKAAAAMATKEAAYFDIAGKQITARENFVAAQKTAIDMVNQKPAAGSEKLSSKLARKMANIHTDSELQQKYIDMKAKFEKHGVPVTEAELLRRVANGEVPAFSKGEKFTRGVKTVGMRMILENLGPIINPVPDVPGLVTLASYGVEAFGGQWWAGLIPPVWQYLHNRYEDVAIGMDTFSRAKDIVKRHWNAKIDKLTETKIEKAAGVFLPKKEFVPSV